MSSKTIVLISGANQGIGFEISKKLATEQSSFHVIMGARDLAKGEEAAAALSNLVGTVEAIQLDITSDDSIEACVALIDKKHGSLDVLINNAGISTAAVTDLPTARAKYKAIFDVNVFGTACLTDACLPLLRKASSRVPRIVFVSSEMGSMGNVLNPKFPYYKMIIPPYQASKAAMNDLGVTYAVALGDEGFKVNMCCPGLRATNLSRGRRHPKMMDAAGGAVNACRLAMLGADGESGTFSNVDGPMPW